MTQLAKKESSIVDGVLTKVEQFKDAGQLHLPKDYSAANALKSAYLILKDTKDKNDRSVLEVCSRESIANALLNMVTQGLNPMKHQVAFIAYGSKLIAQRQYQGTIALAKRFGNIKDITAQVIYEGDKFVYDIDKDSGRYKLINHVQEFKNIDNNKIIGAYALVTFNDDRENHLEIMSMFQIQQAWNMGNQKGNSKAHSMFKDQMAKKTVITRACKLFIEGSDDSSIMPEHELPELDEKKAISNANTESLSFDEAEECDTKQLPEQHQPEQQPEAVETKKPEVKREAGF